jgi:PAS domain-containing protein
VVKLAAIEAHMSQMISSSLLNSNHLEAEFRSKLEELSSIVREHGFNVTAYESSELPHFNALSAHAQTSALASVDFYLSLCLETMSAGEPLLKSQQLTWRAMRRFGLIPNPDLFTKIGGEDIIEIFDTDNIQIFRNFQFFKLCSYSLESLFCRPWMDLFRRLDSQKTVEIFEFAVAAQKSQTREVLDCTFGEHLVQETDSPKRNLFAMIIKSYALLFDSKSRFKGSVVVESAKLIPKTSEL